MAKFDDLTITNNGLDMIALFSIRCKTNFYKDKVR